MAYETDRYREKALDLIREGFSYRGVARKLAEEHDREVVSYGTVRRWHRMNERQEQNASAA
jgi:transposase